MLIVGIVVLAVGLYSIIVTLSNIITMHSMRMKKQSETPKVSVCIPARNEEENIERCVRSFMDQDYPNMEIIVLDDNSEDSTPEILKRLSEEDSRIRVMKGKPLAEGWRGKVYGMSQMLEAATGDYILFTDADTMHKKISVRYGVDLLLTNHAKMVSGYPEELADSPLSASCIAIIVLNTMFYLPVRVQNKMQFTHYAMAIGQYMMMEKQSLLEVGGMEKIKNANDDDVNLARLFCSTGHKQIFANMKYALSCMMYPNFKDSFKGMERCFISAIKFTPLMWALMPFAVLILLGMTALPVLAILGLIFFKLSLPSILFALGTLLLYIAYGVITNYHGFKFPVQLMGMFTFGICMILLVRGLWHQIFKKEIVWKGRKVTYNG